MQAQMPVIKIPGSDYNATGQREAFLTQAFFLSTCGVEQGAVHVLLTSL